MADRTTNEMEKLSLRTNTRFPCDFFTAGNAPPPRSDPYQDLGSGSGDDLELNLGLSLGGRFGVDKKTSTKLLRSSSIANILPHDDALGSSGHENPGPVPGQSYSGLVRTTSLPVETEEEWRKRKELESLRRLAAKRRRSDKQRNLFTGGEVGSSAGPPFRSKKWPPDLGTTAICGSSKGGGGWLSSKGRTPQFERKHRQGSRGHERSSSLQESSSGSSPSSAGQEPEHEPGSSCKKNAGKEIGSPEDMPCVFTQGDGPNGRVVEGILYKYGKGEQVKIMCVCHGSFLSPAEFVKHAGGTDFLHPLKHIVVKPSSSFS